MTSTTNIARPRTFMTSVRIMDCFIDGSGIARSEPPINWAMLQLTSGATLFLRNISFLDLG